MPKRVFIIYGRDIEAHDELVKFITALGLEELPFESVADELDDPNPFIAEIVFQGISKADAVIALFTPDEQAALYSPETAEFQGRDETRWQARSNVIFEAGVAFGIARKKTVLVTLGSDIRLFSDVSGINFIELSKPDAKQRLRKRLNQILEADLICAEQSVPGDFKTCLRKRWDYYDELEGLENELKNTAVYGRKKSLFDIVEDIALRNPGARWEDWTSSNFMHAISRKSNNDSTDSAYWYLIITGFITFNDIEPWWEPRCLDGYEYCKDYWANSVEFSRVTPRGIGLLYKLQRRAR